MKAHLMIDLLAGIFLAASPWIFGFSEEVFLPYLILGIAEIGASLMTKQPLHIWKLLEEKQLFILL